jgi:mannose-6-phosphate isomerase-like protein (cupin superfamily)
MMKARASTLLQRLPGPVSTQWPDGQRFIEAMRHGSMSVEIYAPIGVDPQTPHDQDELYFVQTGRGTLRIGHEVHAFEAGDCLFVAAGVEHRFEAFTPDFSTWVVFWGPKGGE